MKYLVLAGLIACAFVLGASLFGPRLSVALSDVMCDASPRCAASVESVARTAPPAETAQTATPSKFAY